MPELNAGGQYGVEVGVLGDGGDSRVDLGEHGRHFRFLLQLRRGELQGVCDALALDAGGREKAKLVDRAFSGFRTDLGTESGLTWAPVPGTWAPNPA